MQDLSMNINVAKARTILNMVCGHTGVDSYLLLDDDTFGALLTEKAHNAPVARAVVELTNWVNENY